MLRSRKRDGDKKKRNTTKKILFGLGETKSKIRNTNLLTQNFFSYLKLSKIFKIRNTKNNFPHNYQHRMIYGCARLAVRHKNFLMRKNHFLNLNIFFPKCVSFIPDLIEIFQNISNVLG